MNQPQHNYSLSSSQKGHGLISGLEVLQFDSVELLKKKGDKTQFSSVGTLHVFYFPDYDRFILYLNDWAFALLKRIPVVRSLKNSTNSFFYVFPSYSGSHIIKLTKCPYKEALQNFETILAHNSQFSYQEDVSYTPEKPRRSGDFSHTLDTSKESSSSSLLGNLSNREKISREFKKIASKFQRPINTTDVHPNVKSLKDYNSLKYSTLPSSFIHYYERRDVEAIIIRCKHIAQTLGHVVNREEQELKQSFVSESPNPKLKTIPTTSRTSEERPKRSFIPRQSDELRDIEDELSIIQEIERERILQLEERTMAEKHDILNRLYEVKEREMQDHLKGDFDDLKAMQAQEKDFLEEIQLHDSKIAELEKMIKTENPNETQLELKERLKNELAQLWYQEQLVEAEHLQLKTKSEELLPLLRKKQEDLLKIGNIKSEIFKIAEAKDAEIRERWKAAEMEIDEIHHEAEDLKTKAKCKFLEIMQREEIAERELEEISQHRQELLKLVEEREAERLEFEKSISNLHQEEKHFLNELLEKENTADMKLADLEKKKKELEMEVGGRLNRITRMLDFLETENSQLLERKEMLDLAILLEKEEIVRLHKRQKQAEERFEQANAGLQQRTKANEREQKELERIRREMSGSAQLNDAICDELEQRMNELQMEARKKEWELVEKEEQIEAKRLELKKKEEELLERIQSANLDYGKRDKELDSKRLELSSQNREITRLFELCKTETPNILDDIEKVRAHEEELFSYNQELLSSYQAASKELRRMEKELTSSREFRRLGREHLIDSLSLDTEQTLGLS